MSSRLRHWRQRWDRDAEFVFAKRMLLNGEYTEPGQRVEKGQIALHRLKQWWNAGYIALFDSETMGDKPSIRRLTSKAWEVYVPGGKPRRFNSAEDAQDFVDSLEIVVLSDEELAALVKEEPEAIKDAVEDEPRLEQISARKFELHIPGQEVVKINGKNKAMAALHEASGR